MVIGFNAWCDVEADVKVSAVEHRFNALADEVLEDGAAFGVELPTNLQVAIEIIPHLEMGFAALLFESAEATVRHEGLRSIFGVTVKIVGVHVRCGIDE